VAAVNRDYLIAAPSQGTLSNTLRLAMVGAIPKVSPPARLANAQLVRPGCPATCSS
jgi:hypothetical protein